MFLRVEGLSKYYPNAIALDNINFNLAEGLFLCILGPSGCGKSTLLRCLGGFVEPDAGNIFLYDQNITQAPPQERPISTVFQSYGLFPHMNVLKNVTYGLKFKNLNQKEIISQGMEMLELLNLSGYANKKINELSGGEQQRVALGRSLIVKPKLLLLDEPLSNLDAKLRISMRDEIKKIQQTFNITTIFVTHDQDEALTMADKIVLMDKAKIEQIGTPREIYEQPNSRFAIDFIGSANFLAEKNSYVRPEAITIHKTMNEANAQVVQIEFHGDIITYSVELFATKNRLKVIKLNTLENNIQVGDHVFVDYMAKTYNNN